MASASRHHRKGFGWRAALDSVPKDRSAFTLLELIVVIAILGLLISIIVPALNTGHPPAQSLQCLSRMRQIGMAIAQYRHDNRGQFPPSLASLSSKMLPKVVVFLCPASKAQTQSTRFTDDISARAAQQLDFVYVGKSLGPKSAATLPVLLEPINRHSRNTRSNVCFVDGSAKTMLREEVLKLAETLHDAKRLTDEEYNFIVGK